MSRKKKLIFFCLSIFIVDRITKVIAVQFHSASFSLGTFVRFQTSYNTGIAWGVTPPVWLSMILMPLIFLILIFWVRRAYAQEYMMEMIASSAILVGAVSNLLDRFIYGGVIDFVAIGWWPVFNIADILITFGVLVAMTHILRYETLPKK